MDFDDEILQEFLAESREHLADIENRLLTIEEQGRDLDEALVNQVFRAAHSIKGGASFLELTRIRDLAHKAENVLDMLRSRRMPATHEVITALLEGFDRLRQLTANPEAARTVEIADVERALVETAGQYLPMERKAQLSERLPVGQAERMPALEASEFDLAEARAAGNELQRIECDLIHDVKRRGKTPFDLIRILVDLGSILDTKFDLFSVGTLEDDFSNKLPLEILFASRASPGEVAAALEVHASQVTLLAWPDLPDRDTPTENRGGASRLAGAPEIRSGPAADSRSAPSPPGSIANQEAAATVETTIRLNVSLLESLMTLAGELVLSRNQLSDSLSRNDERAIRASEQRINVVTSELQAVVTRTRMQPVGTVFSRFSRVVRDLSRELGKEVELVTEGADVEIDKTILEGLQDPVTHMVRNALDHGLETPAERSAAGKRTRGTLLLRASQEAGQVLLEVADDGRGLPVDRVVAAALARGAVTQAQVEAMGEADKLALVLLPGVSTAKQVSDLSGRGVGMDVVKANLDRLGGRIEIASRPGLGTTFRIKVPLTLAIVPSLLISSGGIRFAIPQAAVRELIRILPAQRGERVRQVGGAEVLGLRDRLVPLLRLSEALDLQPLAPTPSAGIAPYSARPASTEAAWNIVIVDTGTFEYGLVVEELHDTIEIVVKPLGRHLKALTHYAGATVLGDGQVALILDVAGLALRAGLSAQPFLSEAAAEEAAVEQESISLLQFENAVGEKCAIPVYLISRIERVARAQIEWLGGRRSMQHEDRSLPVVALSDLAQVGQVDEGQRWVVLVFEHEGRTLGLLGAEPLDLVEARLHLDRETLRQPGVTGSVVLNGHTTLVLDLAELAAAVPGASRRGDPGSIESIPAASCPAAEGAPLTVPALRPKVLLAEDSDFFRGQLQALLEGVGCRVVAAEDGEAAWQALEAHGGEIALVATDIEMPRLDGLGLTRRIRSDQRFAGLPVIAISTLAGEEEIARGLAAGVSEYQVKLDKEQLAGSIRRRLRFPANGAEEALTRSGSAVP